MATLFPDITVETGDLALRDDYLEQAPLLYHTVAAQINAESGSSAAGHFDRGTGDLVSHGTVKYQDTYKSGTGGRTGSAFTVVSGTWYDDVVMAATSGKYALCMLDSSLDITSEVVEVNTDPFTTDRVLILHRGVSQVSASRMPEGSYSYIELNYASSVKNGQYRLSFEWGTPLRLEYRNATTGGPNNDGWKHVAVCSDMIDAGTYFQNNGGHCRVTIQLSPKTGVLVAKVPGCKPMRHAVPRPSSPTQGNQVGTYPDVWNVRVTSKNGWVGLEWHPIRYRSQKISKAKMKVNRPVNTTGAKVVTNLLGPQDTDMAVSSTVSQDGNYDLGYDLTASKTDAGDGLGSATAPRVSDVLIYIPAVWSRAASGGSTSYVRTVQVREQTVLDDNLRIMYNNGDVAFQNYDSRYSGAYGQYAINLRAGNGQVRATRLTGIAGHGDQGITYLRSDPVRTGSLPFTDFMWKLNLPVLNELVLDGLSANTAVRILLEQAGISPKYLGFIPNDGFPPYPDGAWLPILGKGTGLDAKYRFTPSNTVIQALLSIVADTGLVVSNIGSIKTSIPYYFWFDAYGMAHFEPYNPGWYAPKKSYSSYPNPGDTGIITNLQVSNSVANIRTGITVQGQDALTHELLHYHQDLRQNRAIVGYNNEGLLRGSRYGTPQYVQEIARTASVQASLPTQILDFDTIWDPTVFAGDVILVSDDRLLGGTYLYNVLETRSIYGWDPGQQVGAPVMASHIRARSLINSLPL